MEVEETGIPTAHCKCKNGYFDPEKKTISATDAGDLVCAVIDENIDETKDDETKEDETKEDETKSDDKEAETDITALTAAVQALIDLFRNLFNLFTNLGNMVRFY